MNLSGYISVVIDGQDIGFKFGMNAWSEFCRIREIDLSDIDSTGLFGRINEKGETEGTDPSAIRDLFYCAAWADCMERGKSVWFNRFTVGNWIDEMPQADFDRIRDALFNSRIFGKQLLKSLSGHDEKKN